jgi:threonine dehydrogenase-like Zn-dependent dehydrogenase
MTRPGTVPGPIPATMRAAVLYGAGDLRVVDRPVPEPRAEEVLVGALYRLPDRVGADDAVLLTTAGTGLYGLETAGGYVAGQDVVVFGPGAVGLMTVQLCKRMGAARVILVGTRESRLRLGRDLGADHTVDATEADPVRAVLDLTGGQGADLVIEASGGWTRRTSAAGRSGGAARSCSSPSTRRPYGST